MGKVACVTVHLTMGGPTAGTRIKHMQEMCLLWEGSHNIGGVLIERQCYPHSVYVHQLLMSCPSTAQPALLSAGLIRRNSNQAG